MHLKGRKEHEGIALLGLSRDADNVEFCVSPLRHIVQIHQHRGSPLVPLVACVFDRKGVLVGQKVLLWLVARNLRTMSR